MLFMEARINTNVGVRGLNWASIADNNQPPQFRKLNRLHSLINDIYPARNPTPQSVDHAAHAGGPSTWLLHVDNQQEPTYIKTSDPHSVNRMLHNLIFSPTASSE